jgi:hypothetical protein
MNIKNSLNLVTLVLVIVVGGTAFFGGMKYQENKTVQAMKSQYATNPFSGRNRNQAGGTETNTASTGVGQRRMGNGQVIGEITSVADNSITVKMTDGSSKIILLSDKTSINKASVATKSDLKVGEKVAAFGTPNTDGSVSGSSVQLNPTMPNVPSGTPSGSPPKN